MVNRSNAASADLDEPCIFEINVMFSVQKKNRLKRF